MLRAQRSCTSHREAAVITFCALTTAAALAWLYLLHVAGGKLAHRAPLAARRIRAALAPPDRRRHSGQERGRYSPGLPAVPARSQEYPAGLCVFLVDDDSTDATAKTAARLGEGRDLTVVSARPTPPGWASKVWAMAEGVRAAGPGDGYLLFTDADIAYAPGTVTRLAEAAASGRFAMVSQMALLRTGNRAEKLLVPAFVYSLPSSTRSRESAAAGQGQPQRRAAACWCVPARSLPPGAWTDRRRADRRRRARPAAEARGRALLARPDHRRDQPAPV